MEENDDLSNKQFVDQMKMVAELAFISGGEKELRKITLFDQYFRALDNQQQTENFCGAGKSYLMVDAQNNLYTCPWDVGTKAEQVGHGSYLNDELLAAYQEPLIEKNNCRKAAGLAFYAEAAACLFTAGATEAKTGKTVNFASEHEA